MALNMQEVPIFPVGTLVAVGGTEAAPTASGTGVITQAFADYACSMGYRILNGSVAPGSPLTVAFYGVRDDGALVEFDRAFGTTNSSSAETSAGILPPSGSVACPPGYKRFTARAFGNTSREVGVEVFLMRQVP